ncbi:MAG TPA: hypothetical protein VGB39_05965 [Sphingomicrobium sp.]|jgi:hypothetical protein
MLDRRSPVVRTFEQKAIMIHPIDILALSQPDFVRTQVRSMFSVGQPARRESFWRSWGFPEP